MRIPLLVGWWLPQEQGLFRVQTLLCLTEGVRSDPPLGRDWVLTPQVPCLVEGLGFSSLNPVIPRWFGRVCCFS